MAAPPPPPPLLLLPRVMLRCWPDAVFGSPVVWFGVLSLLVSQYELVYEFAVHLVK
jgi:hypothetical protein